MTILIYSFLQVLEPLKMVAVRGYGRSWLVALSVLLLCSSAAAIIPLGGGDECFLLDFSEFATGERIDSKNAEYEATYGISFSQAHKPGRTGTRYPMIAFDSSSPTGGDFDLGSPSWKCCPACSNPLTQNCKALGCPGYDNDWETSTQGGPGEIYENCEPRGKVAILQEVPGVSGGIYTTPDDDTNGGRMIFNFVNPVKVVSMGALDIEETNNILGTFSGGVFLAYDSANNLISGGSVDIPSTENGNTYQIVNLNVAGVSKLIVELVGSGSIDDLIFCRGM